MTMSQNYLIRIDEPERPFTELAEVPRQKERQLQLVEEPMFFLPSFRGILQTDMFNRYRLLFSAECQDCAFIKVPCRFHTCPKIHGVHTCSKSTTAEETLKCISELYGACRSPASERLTLKQMRSKPLLTPLCKLRYK